MNIAVVERQTIYDSLYLACAVQAGCRLITADERFIQSIKSPQLKPHIVSLNDPDLEL
jgi:predicted nucleic acid-binding protein